MSKKSSYHVAFLPSGRMEDFLSEKVVVVQASTQDEAYSKAVTQITDQDPESLMDYRLEDPMIQKVA